MPQTVKAIFFHMGPGFHARIEKEKFGSQYPDVLFIDQPSGLTFKDLVQWSVQEIRAARQQSEGPLILLAHSFGAQLVAEAASQAPDLIAEVRILNSAYDPFHSFIHLEKFFLGEKALGSSHWLQQTAAVKMNLILSLARTPGLAEAYWQSTQAKQNYDSIAAHHPPLNVEGFIKTFSDFLEHQQGLKKKTWSGKARVFYSTKDHLIKDFATVESWRNVFPQVQFVSLDAGGHHGLFEVSSLPQIFFKSDK